MARKAPFRIRIARAVSAFRAKEFIPALTPFDSMSTDGSGRINQFVTKADQLGANVGWCFTANNAIAEPFSSIPLELYRRTAGGKRDKIEEHEILNLLKSPNFAHTGEQMRQLHATYMNFTGESYIYMRDGSNPFEPKKGKIPDALDIFPSHLVQFQLGETYTSSTVRLGGNAYPVTSFIRDLNPDPNQPYSGRSIIAASAVAIDMDTQMKTWNQGVFARGGHPGIIVSVKEPMEQKVYDRFRQQIDDEVSGTENAHRPLIVEGEGTATPYMMNAKDLDFLQSRKFSKDEIFAMWRVSPGIVGMTENVNRANLDSAFYLNAVINLVPRIRQFVNQVNATLVYKFDPKMELDFVNPVPEDVQAKIAYAEKASGGWLTIDEVRGLYGHEPLPNGLGTQIYIPALNTSLEAHQEAEVPASEANAEADAKVEPSGKVLQPAGVKKQLTPDELEAARERKGEAKAARYNLRRQIYEQALLTALQQQFQAQRTQLLQNIATNPIRKSLKGRRTKDDQSNRPSKHDKRDWLSLVLFWPDYNESMRLAMAPILYGLIAETGKDAMQQIGMDPSQFDAFKSDILNYNRARSIKIAEDVNRETEKQLRASLTEGINDGESPDELQAQVELIMGAALTYRADRIAGTETVRAQGYADISAWTQSGIVTGKEWYCAAVGLGRRIKELKI